jgi:hypothetical protein
MQPRPSRFPALGLRPLGWVGLLAFAAKPASAMPLEWAPEDWLGTGLLGLIALLLLGNLTLSLIAFRRSRNPPPAPGLTRAEMEEMRRSVTAFAGLLREGSAMMLQHQQDTLEAVERVAAHSQQLIALVANSEERVTNATARSEILATRVARSAAAEVKTSIESLTAISARIEYQARAMEEAIRPAGARAA